MRSPRWLLALLLAGCAQSTAPEHDVVVTKEQIPAVVMKTVRERFPNFKFSSAYQLERGIYEIRVQDKQGRTHEIEVGPTGEVVEID